MGDNNDNFGGTTLTGENGEQMDPAIAGISPPGTPTIGGDAAGAALGAAVEVDDAGKAEIAALDEEGGEMMTDKAALIDADSVLDPVPVEGGEAAEESEAQPS